jgi:hypothetical protein
MYRSRSEVKLWRVILVYALMAWLPIAGQSALVCCLPCMLHDDYSAVAHNTPNDAQNSHRGDSSPE